MPSRNFLSRTLLAVLACLAPTRLVFISPAQATPIQEKVSQDQDEHHRRFTDTDDCNPTEEAQRQMGYRRMGSL